MAEDGLEDGLAEGVESAAQLDRLRDLGADEAQGWHLGRPMPPGQAFSSSASVPA